MGIAVSALLAKTNTRNKVCKNKVLQGPAPLVGQGLTPLVRRNDSFETVPGGDSVADDKENQHKSQFKLAVYPRCLI